MSSTNGKWVVLRYRTKRGERKHTRIFDVFDSLDRMITALESAGCYEFTFEEA